MCYGQFNNGECCEPDDKPGFMDFYCLTSVRTRMSSSRFFSRSCSTNTKENAANGRHIEGQWGVERAAKDQHRAIYQSIASHDGKAVFCIENCNPTFIDEGITGDWGSLSSREQSWPIVDTSGKGWKVEDLTLGGQIATFDLQRSDVSGIISPRFVSGLGAGSFGLIFRHVDKDNFLRLRWEPFGYTTVVLEKVVAGVPSTITSVLQTPNSYLGITISVSLNGPIVGISGSGGFSLTANISQFQTATRFGIAKSGLNEWAVDQIDFRAKDTKEYVSVYNAGATATIGGQHLNTSEDNARYSHVPCAVGNGIAFQSMQPNDFGYFDFYGHLLNKNLGIGFGPGVIPMINNPLGTGPAPGFFWGGREISSSASITQRTFLESKYESWTQNDALLDGIFNQTEGAVWWVIGYGVFAQATLSRLGKETIGACPKYGFPNCAGAIISEVSVTGQSPEFYVPGNVTIGFLATTWKIKGRYKMIAGPLIWDTSRYPRAPHTSEQEVLAEWDEEAIVTVTNGDVGDMYYGIQEPNENDKRYGLLNPGYVPTIWDCTPGMESYVAKINKRTRLLSGNWSGLDGPQPATELFGDWCPSKIKSGGSVIEFTNDWDFGEFALSKTAVAIRLSNQLLNLETFRIYKGGSISYEQISGQNGVTRAPAPFNMSDRFVYATVVFSSEAQAHAWMSVDIPLTVKLKDSQTGSTAVAISYDGSIRYPLLAVSGVYGTPVQGNYIAPTYEPRKVLELEGQAKYSPPFGAHTLGLGLGYSADCIKDSSLPYSPPLKNPTF